MSRNKNKNKMASQQIKKQQIEQLQQNKQQRFTTFIYRQHV